MVRRQSSNYHWYFLSLCGREECHEATSQVSTDTHEVVTKSLSSLSLSLSLSHNEVGQITQGDQRHRCIILREVCGVPNFTLTPKQSGLINITLILLHTQTVGSAYKGICRLVRCKREILYVAPCTHLVAQVLHILCASARLVTFHR